MGTRIIIYTESIKKNDADAFFNAASKLHKIYMRLYPSDQPNCILKKAASGEDIVATINNCGLSSIISLDIVSHGNAGGIHIARDFTNRGFIDVPVSSFRQIAHISVRTRYPAGHTIPTLSDAAISEESMHGLYTDSKGKTLVGIYFNQVEQENGGIRYLSDIAYDRFANECFVELHGCLMAEDVGLFGVATNFAQSFSSKLGSRGIVVGHKTKTNPGGTQSDYRRGRVQAYCEGKPVGQAQQRQRLHWVNSSTPQ